MKAKLGIAPIAWWNDDLPELSDDVSLEECLRQASVAGFTGMETGRRFPMDMKELGPVLDKYGISVCGGWFSGLLLDGDIEAEKDRIARQMEFFIAARAPCIVYGETARSIQGVRSAPLSTKPKLSEAEMAAYGRKMSDFADWCAKQAGHMAFAGGDVMRVIDNHHRRITHVHTKDIRQTVIDGLDRTRESFLDAIIKGAFTVPGDGSLDFEAIVKALAGKGYEGWFVVEAEQDPVAHPPLEMARKGHKELLRVMAAAKYEVVK